MNYITLIRGILILGLVLTVPLSCSSGLTDITGANYVSAKINYDTKPDVTESDLLDLVRANNSFAIDLYKELSEKNDNFFLSPFSLSQGLTMVWAGSSGETSRQISDVLHYTDLEPSNVHASFNSINLNMESRSGVDIDVLNSIWAQKDEPWKMEFLELMKQRYRCGIYEVDFKNDPNSCWNAMNSWVSKATRNKIRESFEKSSIDKLTVMCLLDVVYFMGEWEHKFKKSKTKEANFYLLDETYAKVDMMKLEKTEFNVWFEGSGYGTACVEMPYKDSDLALMAVAPYYGEFVDFESELSVEKIDEIVTNMHVRKINLYFPKIESHFNFDMKSVLAEMGMVDAFSLMSADFSNLSDSGGIFISDAIQKTYLKIDEEGTIAIAFSGFNVRRSAPSEISFNRPFFFFIRDRSTGLILFIGRITNPSLL